MMWDDVIPRFKRNEWAGEEVSTFIRIREMVCWNPN